NEEGIDVLLFENFADVFFGLRCALLLVLDDLDGPGQDIAIGIDDVGNLGARQTSEARNQATAAAVDAHDGEDDLLAGLCGGSSGSQRRESRGGGGGRFEEVTAVGSVHGESPGCGWRASGLMALALCMTFEGGSRLAACVPVHGREGEPLNRASD